MPQSLLAPITLLAALAFAGSPLLSNGFRGFTPGQFPVISDSWPIVPVGWAFAIWGVIYLWLVLGALVGLVRAFSEPEWQQMRRPLALSLGIGAFWIAAANLQPVLATVMLIFMAATAIAAFLRAPAGVWSAWAVGLYAGWTTAACGVAIAISLSGQGVLTSQNAAYLCLLGVIAVALAVLWRRAEVLSYAFGVAWALWGVIVANLHRGNLPVVALAAFGLAGVALMVVLRRRKMR